MAGPLGGLPLATCSGPLNLVPCSQLQRLPLCLRFALPAEALRYRQLSRLLSGSAS